MTDVEWTPKGEDLAKLRQAFRAIHRHAERMLDGAIDEDDVMAILALSELGLIHAHAAVLDEEAAL